MSHQWFILSSGGALLIFRLLQQSRKRHSGVCNGGGVPVTINNTGCDPTRIRWRAGVTTDSRHSSQTQISHSFVRIGVDLLFVQGAFCQRPAFLCQHSTYLATMPLGLKPCCAVCKTNSSSMWKKGNQGEILCNNCTGKSSSGGPAGPSIISSIQPSNGGGKQVSA